MQQLEIKFFYPLTEQIPLDLDFTPSKEYEEAKRAERLVNSVTYTNINTIDGRYDLSSITTTSNYSATLEVRPYHDPAGAIEVTPDFHVYVKTKPNWLARFSMKKIFGWNWKDK